MSLERIMLLSTRRACSSLQQAVTCANHAQACSCVNCVHKWTVSAGLRGLRSTATPHRQTKPKRVLADAVPPRYPYVGTQQVNNQEYTAKLREYREQVAELRKAWRPEVDKHNQQLQRLKQERDEVRLSAQDENLKRQYDRWKVPERLKTSQQIRSDPESREMSYARHALRSSLTQVSRVAQAEVLLRESATWVEPEKLDEAIATALENPTDLFAGGEPWADTLESVPEYVEGFEGPQVDRNTPEFLRRRRKKTKKTPAAVRPAW